MIRLVQPAPGRAVSGGYRFNDEMLRRLERDARGQSTTLDELTARMPDAADTLVVDSLYLSSAAPEAVRGFEGETCLLVHYLPSREPQLSGPRRARRLACEASWLDCADRVLVPSRRFGDVMPAHLERYVVTPGLDNAFRAPIAAYVLPCGGEAVRLVSVQAMTEGKNLLAILRSLAGVAPDRFVWDIVGDRHRDPGYRDRFTHALAASGRSHRVRFHERLSPAAVASLLDGAHLYVTASREESYGMATAEAVARGVPVLSFDVGSVSRWVRSGVNGHVFAVGEEHAFEKNLRDLLHGPGLAELARGARANADRLRFPSWDETYCAFLVGVGTPTVAA